MRPNVVVVAPPAFDTHLRFRAIPKPLQRQMLVAKLAVEGLVRAVLPRLPGIDEGGVDASRLQPPDDRRGDELGAIVPSEDEVKADKCFSRMGLPQLRPEETASHDLTFFYHGLRRVGSD